MTKLHKWSFIGFIQVKTSEKKYKHQEISKIFCTHWTIDVLEFAPPSANNGTIYAFHNLIFYEYNIDTIVTVAFVYIWLIRYLLDIYYFTRLKFTFHFRCVNYLRQWRTWTQTSKFYKRFSGCIKGYQVFRAQKFRLIANQKLCWMCHWI